MGVPEPNRLQGFAGPLLGLALILQLLLISPASAVDRHKFRTCATTGFCTAYRSVAGPAVFEADTAPLALAEGGTLLRNQYVSLECLASGAIRVRMDKGPKRWEYDQVLVDTTRVPFVEEKTAGSRYECASQSTVQLDPSSRKLSFFRLKADKPYLVLNERGLTYIEVASSSESAQKASEPGVSQLSSNKEESAKQERKIIDWGEDGKPIYEDQGGSEEAKKDENQAEEAAPAVTESPTTSRSAPETFGGFTDNKPHGPMSVGFDITFHDAAGGSISLHGIPEHATAFSLKDTDGSVGAYKDPYRLYNLDVFEYELDEPMALYGSVPYLMARSSKDEYAGVFFNNPSEVFVDVTTPEKGARATRWVAETGVLEVFVFPGGPTGTMSSVLNQMTTLTGRPYLPPMFSLGYHQCRWNYRDQKDVEEVHAKFEELDFPFDVLWLDIEHTDGKRYFTWDLTKFPQPVQMQDDLKRTGRRMVTIVDPHVKRDNNYFVHAEAEKNGYYLKDGTQDLDGWCWPGSSSYPDFTSPKVREWWGGLYSRYEGSTDRLATWIDMNEMSLFNGPEVTMKKTAVNLNGIEHREWHNIYGMSYHQATFEGIRKARKDQRPFILTRSFFAGTQRFGAIWNGDNKADWTHLQVTAPMLLAMSVSGLSFVGADVGGFFGNPDPELLVRWYESGAFQPFFRAHAHIETKRREPWLFGDEVLAQIRSVVMDRYRHLPYIYSTFEEASRTGMPVMRPVFGAVSNQAMENAWLLGSDLFVYPVLAPAERRINLADVPSVGEFVHFETGRPALRGATFDAPLGKTPVFQRVGSIVPKQMRLRRSSELMFRDPYTLYVAVDTKTGTAEGRLYMDDQVSFAHQRGEYVSVSFKLSGCGDSGDKCVLRGNVARASGGSFSPQNKIERVRFVGGSPKKLGCGSQSAQAEQDGKKWTFEVECDVAGNSLVWRKPWVDVAKDFVITVL